MSDELALSLFEVWMEGLSEAGFQEPLIYQPGMTVTGTIAICPEEDIQECTVEVFLEGRDIVEFLDGSHIKRVEGTLPNTGRDRATVVWSGENGPLKGGEKQEIPFSYKLPSARHASQMAPHLDVTSAVPVPCGKSTFEYSLSAHIRVTKRKMIVLKKTQTNTARYPVEVYPEVPIRESKLSKRADVNVGACLGCAQFGPFAAAVQRPSASQAKDPFKFSLVCDNNSRVAVQGVKVLVREVVQLVPPPDCKVSLAKRKLRGERTFQQYIPFDVAAGDINLRQDLEAVLPNAEKMLPTFKGPITKISHFLELKFYFLPQLVVFRPTCKLPPISTTFAKHVVENAEHDDEPEAVTTDKFIQQRIDDGDAEF